jgi:DNA polymerase II small subunit/DNA polymerase delta subunit B
MTIIYSAVSYFGFVCTPCWNSAIDIIKRISIDGGLSKLSIINKIGAIVDGIKVYVGDGDSIGVAVRGSIKL